MKNCSFTAYAESEGRIPAFELMLCKEQWQWKRMQCLASFAFQIALELQGVKGRWCPAVMLAGFGTEIPSLVNNEKRLCRLSVSSTFSYFCSSGDQCFWLRMPIRIVFFSFPRRIWLFAFKRPSEHLFIWHLVAFSFLKNGGEYAYIQNLFGLGYNLFLKGKSIL